MLKKFGWIVALLAALSMVFIGCGEERDHGEWDLGNVTWKHITIPGRSQGWHSIDIRDAGTAPDLWTAGKAHTITVWGRAVNGGNTIKFGEAKENYAGYSPSVAVDASNDSRFRLEHTFTWEQLESGQNIRIADISAAASQVFYWEILIKDADGKEIYRLSDDPEVQDKAHMDVLLTEGGFTTKWFIGALGGGNPDPEAIVWDPNATGGCSSYQCSLCSR